MNPTESAVKVVSLDSADQARRIDEAIAHRAYEIFERRGGKGWHEPEDWRQAESEVCTKLCCSLSSSIDSLLVGFSIARFEEGTVEVWIAPLKMTICGKPIPHKERTAKPALSYKGMLFRTITLPVEVEPRRAVASVKRSFVEMRLPLVRVTYGERSPAQAA